jgi:hypothetical protein
VYGLRTGFRGSSLLAPMDLIDLSTRGSEIYEMLGPRLSVWSLIIPISYDFAAARPNRTTLEAINRAADRDASFGARLIA